MPQYETIAILTPDVGPKQIKAVEEKLEKIIKTSKGALKTVEDWGGRRLAYPIKKQARGHVVYMNYTAGADSQAEITRVFNIDETILRFNNARLTDDYDYLKVKQTFMPEMSHDDFRGPRRGGRFEHRGGDRDHHRGGDEHRGEVGSDAGADDSFTDDGDDQA